MTVSMAAMAALLAGASLVACAADTARVSSREAAMSEFEGVRWMVIEYDNGRGSLVGPIADTRLSLEFAAGRLTGHAGCNALRGDYTRDDARLSLGPLVTTRKACTRQDVMAQEGEMLSALRRVATARIAADGRLELADPAGAPLLRARPAAR